MTATVARATCKERLAPSPFPTLDAQSLERYKNRTTIPYKVILVNTISATFFDPSRTPSRIFPGGEGEACRVSSRNLPGWCAGVGGRGSCGSGVSRARHKKTPPGFVDRRGRGRGHTGTKKPPELLPGVSLFLSATHYVQRQVSAQARWRPRRIYGQRNPPCAQPTGFPVPQQWPRPRRGV